jgi:uncharacterized protein (TIGR03435 family)
MNITAALGLLLVLASGTPAGAQVVRVTPADPTAARQMVFFKPSGPYRIVNYSVRELIRFAYTLDDGHIIGLPAWADSERFDIEQRFETEPSAGEVQALVRDALALQFGLTTHVEQRDFPAYLLRRTGPQLGPGLRRSEVDCTQRPPVTAGVTACQLRLDERGIYGIGLTIAQLAGQMSGSGYIQLQRPVVDRTGLEGRYDMEISLIRMQREQAGPNAGGVRIASVRSEVPLTVLIEREWGLRLEDGTAPNDVLVVDRVMRPMPAPPTRAPALRFARSRHQAPAAPPSFEVVSIRRNTSGEEGGSMVPAPGGRLTLTNVPVRLVIRAAYNLQEFELVGGPSWIDGERYDILTKAEGNPGTQELLAMVRTLLAERFHLQVEEDTTERPIYAMVRVRPDGSLAAGLRPAQPCFRAPVNQPQQPPAGQTSCGFRGAPGSIAGRGVTLGALTFGLSGRVGRPVEDRTGIEGEFDFDLEFAPDVNADGPSIFTSLEEQLGVRLESTRGPTKVLRIVRIERPTED